MCNCVDIQMGTWKNSTSTKLPNSDRQVMIDNCIREEVMGLWEKGIDTVESCCGHNKVNGYIAVRMHCVEAMQKMGYVNQTEKPDRPEIFYQKQYHV